MSPTLEPEHSPLNTAALDRRYEELSDQLRTAQAEIGQIQLEREEKKGPWWRQTAILISVIGLLLSSSFSIYTAADQARQRRAATLQARATALDARLTEIVALRMEDARQSTALAATNLTAYRTWTSVVAVKRGMLVDALVAAVHDLHDDIGATAAIAVGFELIQDGRYAEVERIAKIGLRAAGAAQTPNGVLTSLLAQVYMTPGQPYYNLIRGRKLYNDAIDSFSSSDAPGLNGKLTMMLYWAPFEASLGNRSEADELIQRARQTVGKSPLPILIKAPLAGQIEAIANQIQQAGGGMAFDPSRLLGSWRLFDAENKTSSLIITGIPGSAISSFVRDRIEAGSLVNRMNGTILVSDANHLRLEWNVALAWNQGPMQLAGYSDVTMHPDGVLSGIDYPLGFPSKTWTARKIQPPK